MFVKIHGSGTGFGISCRYWATATRSVFYSDRSFSDWQAHWQLLYKPYREARFLVNLLQWSCMLSPLLP